MDKSTKEIDNDLLINILFQIDKNYSSTLSKNVRLSYIRAIELRSTIFTSKILFGYKKIGQGDKATLVPESSEHIEIINKFFKWYIEVKGFRVIAKLVDEAVFKSKKLRKDLNSL